MHVYYDCSMLRFSVCDIEKLGVAWGRGYMIVYLVNYMYWSRIFLPVPLTLPNSLSKSLIHMISAQLMQQQRARTMASASHGVTLELTGLLPGT